MNRSKRIAVISAALCMIFLLVPGCRNEEEIITQLAIIKDGAVMAAGLESGELMSYETVRAERDIAGLIENGKTESYVKFINDGELQYDLTANTTLTVADRLHVYSARYQNGEFIQSYDGILLSEEERARPDIFRLFHVEYEAADVESIELTVLDAYTNSYSVVMTKDYIDSFDKEENGVRMDCYSVLFNYYVGADGCLNTVLSEYLYTVTDAEGEQQVKMFSQASVEK